MGADGGGSMTDRVTTGQAEDVASACADQWQKRYEIACAATKQAIARAEKAEAIRDDAECRLLLAQAERDRLAAIVEVANKIIGRVSGIACYYDPEHKGQKINKAPRFNGLHAEVSQYLQAAAKGVDS